MAIDEKCPLGYSNKITLNLSPVFKNFTPVLKTAGNSQSISPGNDSLILQLTVNNTSIVSDIKEAELHWILMDEEGNEVCSMAHPQKITLTKGALAFETRNLTVPLSELLASFPDKLIGKKGTLKAQLSIENISTIEIPPVPPLTWDFTYQLTRDDEKDILKQRNTFYTFAKPFTVKFTKGASFPSDYKGYFIIWENDTIGNVANDYSCKIQDDENIIFKYRGNDETQSTILKFSQSGSPSFYVGCDSEGKLNFGNPEGGSPQKFEFNGLFLLTNNLESTGEEFKQLKDLTYFKIIQADIFQAHRPVITYTKNVEKENGRLKYSATMKISNLNPNYKLRNVEFFIVNERGQQIYAKTTPPANSAYVPMNIIIKFKNNPPDYYGPVIEHMNDTTFRLEAEFNSAEYAKSFKVVFPFVDLISDPEKNSIPIMFRYLNRLGGVSMKKNGNNFELDGENKCCYIGIDLE